MGEGFRFGDLIIISSEGVIALCVCGLFASLFWSLAWQNAQNHDVCEPMDQYIIRESPMPKERKDKLDAAYAQCIIKQAEGKRNGYRRSAN